MDNRPIGIFDSGVGGLTVVKQIMDCMPQEKIVYFGDTARVPYGSKSQDTVTRFSKQIVRFLLTQEVKAVIIACNTASAFSMQALQEAFSVPIFGMIVPGAIEAARLTRNKKIGVIGTAGTILSHAYENRILENNSEMTVIAKACPLFVPLAEEGWTQNEITLLTAKKYLGELLECGIDTLVLGCTHYPLLRGCIEKIVGEGICLVDPAMAAAKSVKIYLEAQDMLCEAGAKTKHVFYVSDDTAMFDAICRQAIGESFQPTVIDIEQY